MIIPENENESHKKPLVLSIAGSDPTGGAGIQADLRTFESLGVHGFTVITAITVQTTEKVLDWESISTDLVRTQLHTILENYPIEFMKCGMVPNKEIIQIIKEVKEKYEVPLIFDPILKSGSGKELSEKGIKESMIENLFPSFNETDVLTPNSKEVKALTGIEIKKVDDILTAGKKFEQMGISSILFKGGHISEEKNQVIDYLYQDGGIEMFPHKRVKNATKTHGTGCIFSAALTGNLAIYRDLYTAVQKTEDQIERYFYHLYYVPTKNEKSPKEKVAILDTTGDPQRKEVLREVYDVYDYFQSKVLFSKLVPEVKTNISISLKDAKGKEDVAAVEGRITVVNDKPHACGPVKFNVSNHTARLLLTAQKRDPEIRAVMNLKYKPDYIEALEKVGLYLFEIEREDEETAVENNTMQWVIRESYKKLEKIPDIIWDIGEMGKEPMLRLFARGGKDLTEKLSKIHYAIEKLEKNKNKQF